MATTTVSEATALSKEVWLVPCVPFSDALQKASYARHEAGVLRFVLQMRKEVLRESLTLIPGHPAG